MGFQLRYILVYIYAIHTHVGLPEIMIRIVRIPIHFSNKSKVSKSLVNKIKTLALMRGAQRRTLTVRTPL